MTRAFLSGFIFLFACASHVHQSSPEVAAANETRQAPALREAMSDAPQLVAKGDEERARAKSDADHGDAIGAKLHAEHAMAYYEHARAVSRLARAARERDDATGESERLDSDVRRLSASRKRFEDESRAIEHAPSSYRKFSSAPADRQREAARGSAAKGLIAQARLLCDAAKLLAPTAEGLADAERDLAANAKLVDGANASKGPLIDGAARVRAQCLSALTRARRGGNGDFGDADALLAELSSAGEWSPERDERGVSVELRDASETSVKELGRVARAHPTFALQVIVHDANSPSPAQLAADSERAKAVAHVLVESGADANRIQTETPGADLPIVDPHDTKASARNARVEIVFIAPAAN